MRTVIFFRVHRPRSIVLAGLALLVALGGCGESSSDDGALDVVATTGIGADIVANVTGEEAQVSQIVPDDASPHSYSPSAREQAAIENADLVVEFSPALEEGLPLERADDPFVIADHVRALRSFGAGDVGGEEAGEIDPHVWMDPTQIAAALPALADRLGELDPANASVYRRNAKAYAEELAGVDRDLAKAAASVPPADRKLVTSHDVLGYFADRYGYVVVGTAFGPSPEAEIGASTFSELVDTVEAAGVPAVFAGIGDDPGVLERVSDETGVEVVDDLRLESLDETVPTYVDLLQAAGERIAEALSR